MGGQPPPAAPQQRPGEPEAVPGMPTGDEVEELPVTPVTGTAPTAPASIKSRSIDQLTDEDWAYLIGGIEGPARADGKNEKIPLDDAILLRKMVAKTIKDGVASGKPREQIVSQIEALTKGGVGGGGMIRINALLDAQATSSPTTPPPVTPVTGTAPAQAAPTTAAPAFTAPPAFKYYVTQGPAYEGLEPLAIDDADFELDVIAICCDFAESDYETIAADYSIELDPEMDEDYQKQQVIEHLEGEGAYVGDSINGIVFRQF
jgi:hypothetical protein